MANSLHNLAIIHLKQKKSFTAIRYAQQALRIRESLYGSLLDGHTDLADTLSLMGIIHYDLGEYSDSLGYSMRAYEMRKKLYTGNHPKIANSLYNLGLVYNKLGDEHKSTEYLSRSYEMKKSYFENKTGLYETS